MSGLKNIERISETLDSHYHQMHHFITNSKWDARSVIDQVAKEVGKSLLKNSKPIGLLIDESGWVKKGDKSVGVGHQYCGNVGKTANSQVAVFGCLCSGKHAALIDTRLYLPNSWIKDEKRCDKAGIPKDMRKFMSKPQLALEIIKHQVKLGGNFDFIGGDALYGNDPAFINGVEALGLVYMVDIHSNQLIFQEDPDLFLPKLKSTMGRPPTRMKTSKTAIKVQDYVAGLSDKDWEHLEIRDSAKGVLKGEFHFKKVYVRQRKGNKVWQRLLVVCRKRTKDGTVEIKYSFTNACMKQNTKQTIAYMQAQRFFIEHCFKEQKQLLGLDHFQTRKWISWHHQVALNLLVGSFILREKLLNKEEIPILSARDIMDFLMFKFYKEMTEETLLKQLRERHKKREDDIKRSYSKCKMS